MIDTEYLALLRCPHCAQQDKGALEMQRKNWLTCTDCSRNYPVVEDIPVMLPEEGDRWLNTALDDLPLIEKHDRFVAAG